MRLEQWGGNDERIVLFSLQKSVVGKYRWLSWLSSSGRILLSSAGLACFAKRFIDVRNSSLCVHPVTFPVPV